jgi:hypothetical protein
MKEAAPGGPRLPRWRDASLIQSIAGEVATGVSFDIAGQLFGLGTSTVRTWMSRLEDAVGPDGETLEDRADFAECVAPIARAHAEFFAESERMAAEGHAGRMWLLPRRLQSIYGQRSEVAVSTPDNGVAKLLSRLSGGPPPGTDGTP